MDFVPLEQHHTALSHCFEFHIVTEQSYHCTTHMHTLCPVPYTQFGSFHPQGLVQIKYSELTNVNCIISSIFSLPFHALKWHFRFFCPLNFSLWLRFSFALMLVLAWSWLMLHCIWVFGFSLLVSGYILHCTSALTITWFGYMCSRIIFIFDAIDVEHFEFLVLFSLISLTFHQCVGTFYYCYEIVVSCLFAAERHHFVEDKNDEKKTLATVVTRQ